MGTNINTNHPAFPVQAYPGDASNPKVRPNTGMSMRDYFASKAMNGLLANPEEISLNAPLEEIADFSYKLANAMLVRREKV
jgi:hypothetical protein